MSIQIGAVSLALRFFATGTVQPFTVPTGVHFIRFYMWGAGGRAQNGNTNSYGGQGGGSGAYVEGILRVIPGTTYSIVAGSLGEVGITPAIANGGASAGGTGASGGGFSGIFFETPGATTVIAIAGGGGGSGFNGLGGGGGGGFPSGESGSGGAGGGTQTAGGTGPFPGSQFLGGVAGFGGDCCGGGGGGGLYGGAGGTDGYPGGGGSSTYSSSVTSPITVSGNTGPLGVANGTPTLAPNEASQFWVSPAGRSGQPGLVVIVGFSQTLVSIPRVQFSNIVAPNIRQSFLGTGVVQTFTVPAGVTGIRFFMWGAGGRAQNGATDSNGGQGAGSGAYIEGNIAVVPGTTYSIVVGLVGLVGTAPAIANGGASGGGTGASGGGFSGLFFGTPGATTVIAIAGGGGGSGFNGLGGGGGGGFPSGASVSGGAGGGTQTAGGSGTYPGSQFLGGVAGFGGDCCGGGGGGGWYGGAGGSSGYPGAGGSSTYSSSVFNPVTVSGNTGGVGIANGIPTSAANEASPFWAPPYGRSGQTGLVVIGYSQVNEAGMRWISV